MCFMSCITCDASGIYGSYSGEYGSPIQGGKNIYSEAQTEQKYAIWCRCWYYMSKNEDEILKFFTVYIL